MMLRNFRYGVLDYLGLAVAMAAAYGAAFAIGAEPATNQLAADVVTDRRLTDDHVDSQLNTDDNMPSGIPVESEEGKREAMMLGMKLMERSDGAIIIVDVAATSPAWDAGIRPGDRMISIDSIKPGRLSPWVDDVADVLEDTTDGHAVPAEIERDGERLALRIRLPVSKAAEVRDARQEERALANMAAGNATPMEGGQQNVTQVMPGMEQGVGGSGDYGTGGWGIGGFFGDEMGSNTGDDRMANAAVAQLMAVNNLSGSSANSSASGNRAAQTAGGQVGIAAFQNNGQGVNSIVVVRGLPQGSYQVGIGWGDSGGFGGGNIGANRGMNSGATGSNQFSNDPRNQRFQNGRNRNGNGFEITPAGSDQRQINDQGLPGTQRPGAQLPGGQNQPLPMPKSTPGFNDSNSPVQGGGGEVAPSGAAGGTPTGGSDTGGGASGADGASLADPRSGVLAQQLDPSQIQGVQQAPSNANGSINAQQRNQLGTSQQDMTGQTANDPTQSMPNTNMNNGMGNTGSPSVADIGVIQVGPDGSGRVENQLEGLEVSNLVGMTVTVVNAMSAGGGFDPANAVDPRRSGGQVGNRANAADPRRSGGQAVGGSPSNGNMQANGTSMQNGQPGSSMGIVATGVIQLVGEGNTPNLGEERRGRFPGEERPVDEATRNDRNRSQISNPQEDFSGSSQ